MIFTKEYIRQVILEEITDYVAMKNKVINGTKNTKLDSIRRDLINDFIKFREIATKDGVPSTKDPKKVLEKLLSATKQKYSLEHLSFPKFALFAIKTLQGKADPQLISFIKSTIKTDARMQGYADKLDAYDMSISPEEEKHSDQIRDPDHEFMRVPKSDNAVSDMIDDRKNKKF